MKKELLTAGFVFFSLTLPLKASAAFSQFNVFGDSLSDTGNTFAFTQNFSTGAIPPSPPYAPGRFSDGKVWVDYFGEAIGLQPTPIANLGTTIPTQGVNFAFGGSTSGLDNAFAPGAPGVLAQVSAFAQPLLATNQKVDTNGLYAIWGGGIDYLFGKDPSVEKTVGNISDSVRLLSQVGAKNILVFNLPDSGKTPLALGSINEPALSAATNAHNALLAASITQLNQEIPGINIIPVDISSLFNRAIANPGEFGFKDVTDSCVLYEIFTNQVLRTCDNPNDFLFFDGVHPTTKTHKLVAETALAAIRTKSVPEPSTTFGMLTLGALSAAAMFKYKRKKLTMTRTKSSSAL